MNPRDDEQTSNACLADVAHEVIEVVRTAMALRDGRDDAETPTLCADDIEIETATKRHIAFQTGYRLKILKPCVLSEETTSEQFALRHLQRGVEKSVHAIEASKAWIIECKLLTRLEPHPNLIRLLCLQKVSPTGPTLPNGVEGYFFVTDHIVETLEDRLTAYRRRPPQSTLNEHLQVAVDVASALVQVHACAFVYFVRPEKIGFDACGVTKLFDFGECQSSRIEGHVAAMSDRIETLMYTAPEAFLQEPIGCSADVYSLGIMIWEIATMRKPFRYSRRAEFFEKVVMGEKRPSLEDLPSNCGLEKVLKQCWALKRRPAMESVHRKLVAWSKLDGFTDESCSIQREDLKRHKSDSDTGNLTECLRSLDTGSRRVQRAASSDASKVSRSSYASRKSSNRSEARRRTAKSASFSCTNRSETSNGIDKKTLKTEHQGDSKSTESAPAKESKAIRRRPSMGRLGNNTEHQDRTRRRPSTGRLVVSATELSHTQKPKRRQSTGALESANCELGQPKVNVKQLLQRVAAKDHASHTAFSDVFDFPDPFAEERKDSNSAVDRWTCSEGAQSMFKRPTTSAQSSLRKPKALDTTWKCDSSFDMMNNTRIHDGYGQSFSSRNVTRSKSDDSVLDREASLQQLRSSISNESKLTMECSANSLSQLKASLDKAKECSDSKRDKRTGFAGMRRLGLSGRNLLDDKSSSPPKVKKLIRRKSIVADLSQDYTTSKAS